jgi:Fe2+ or Zn2+ uptake regulation protein
VEDFSTCDVSAVIDQLVETTEYQIEGHWLEVYGRCQSCRAATPAPVS